MKKEALINIIINDLKEVEELIGSFRGEPSVNSAFVELATKKIRNIEEEIFLLNKTFGDATLSTVRKAPEEKTNAGKAGEAQSTDGSIIAESSRRFFSEEAVTPDVEPEVKKAEEAISIKKEKTDIKAVDDSKAVTGTQSVKEKVLKPEKVKEPEVETKSDPKKKTDTVTHAPAGQKKKVSGSRTRLVDVLKKDKNAINERTRHGKTENDLLFSKPVNDIRKAMGINDRFLFQRELFKNNSELFNQTLDQLNKMKSLSDANNFLVSNFGWDSENEVVNSFMKIVKRRFL